MANLWGSDEISGPHCKWFHISPQSYSLFSFSIQTFHTFHLTPHEFLTFSKIWAILQSRLFFISTVTHSSQSAVLCINFPFSFQVIILQVRLRSTLRISPPALLTHWQYFVKTGRTVLNFLTTVQPDWLPYGLGWCWAVVEELYNRQFGLFGLDLEVQCTAVHSLGELRSFQPKVDSPDRVLPRLNSIRLLANIQHSTTWWPCCGLIFIWGPLFWGLVMYDNELRAKENKN